MTGQGIHAIFYLKIIAKRALSVGENMSNNIINSLKRLERLRQENSRATQKAKEAAQKVASMIYDQIHPILFERANQVLENDYVYWKRIHGDLWYVNTGSGYICMDINDEMNGGNYDNYKLETNVSRSCALSFSAAIADDLLEKVADFVESEKIKSEKAVKVLESAKI